VRDSSCRCVDAGVASPGIPPAMTQFFPLSRWSGSEQRSSTSVLLLEYFYSVFLIIIVRYNIGSLYSPVLL
jgi:hypothetical protein